jgi:hypothetical protein
MLQQKEMPRPFILWFFSIFPWLLCVKIAKKCGRLHIGARAHTYWYDKSDKNKHLIRRMTLLFLFYLLKLCSLYIWKKEVVFAFKFIMALISTTVNRIRNRRLWYSIFIVLFFFISFSQDTSNTIFLIIHTMTDTLVKRS